MSQLSIYLDEETEEQLNKAAQAAGVSRSRWVAELIRNRTAAEWPASVVSALGSWPDAPTIDELRQGAGEDVTRERL